MNLEQLTLDVVQSTEINADIGDVYKRTLHRLGEGNAGPDGTSLNMILEEWAGGRWFRDRGEGVQHLWGHVQVLKPPVLIEISGPDVYVISRDQSSRDKAREDRARHERLTSPSGDRNDIGRSSRGHR